MWIFVFHTKKQWFFNSFEQPTSRRAPNFKARAQLQGARRRRDALSAPAHLLSEILKMLTVEAYRKDILDTLRQSPTKSVEPRSVTKTL